MEDVDGAEEVSALPATVGMTVGEFQVDVGIVLYVDEYVDDDDDDDDQDSESVSVEVERRRKSDDVVEML